PTVTCMDVRPPGTLDGVALAGVGGASAINLPARTPQELAAFVYSWIVHMVMPSSGSSRVNQKSRHRCGVSCDEKLVVFAASLDVDRAGDPMLPRSAAVILAVQASTK